MEDRSASAVIVCPTLDLTRASVTVGAALRSAGIEAGVVLVRDYARRGAVHTGNVLLRAALDWGAEHVCYLNDDCYGFPEGWLARLIEAVDSHPQYGVAVAGAKCRTKPQCTGRPGMERGIVQVDDPTAWVVAVLKAKMLREIGDLDENLRHYCDDSDFEMRARAMGWLSIWVQDVWIDHRQEGWDDEWYRQDRAMFRQKWGH